MVNAIFLALNAPLLAGENGIIESHTKPKTYPYFRPLGPGEAFGSDTTILIVPIIRPPIHDSLIYCYYTARVIAPA